ncbi:FAD-binding domain-containing protein [Alteromonas gilva]|uniref:Deoxyribodipyrimidine photo-lyase n=1 Tax=Alteromonas gilva TaxID=2987522 RepID=A0ABT5L1N0_9ALTE|nr:deoxyribodipyrimidine photo-lyase [Alteromonas gilva]MDC8830788.1 deoxyribodipyrimidine photo-lyase [Alteromonas gilva]
MTQHSFPAITVVWFKRDLRLQDHAPLQYAASQSAPVLPLYLFEPDIMADDHYSERHWRFVWQSLLDLEQQLKTVGAAMHVSYESAASFFKRLAGQFAQITVVSYAETGLHCTYQRDQQLVKLFRELGITWREFAYGGVVRALKERHQWLTHWHEAMRAPQQTPALQTMHWLTDRSLVMRLPKALSEALHRPDKAMQTGGERRAQDTLQSFIAARHAQYHRHISSPLNSINSCSRLSAYLAWGNLSIRQVYQAIVTPGRKLPASLRAFVSRLHWHCHFIQKFESECEQQFRHINSGYAAFPYREDAASEQLLEAWQTGNTGVPMVDACMRSVAQTGYLNFRMRAMLVSFLSHYLLIDWRRGVQHLARQFLDFEPGIHYPQFQMQAGVTGTNTLRIYNPVKQAQDNDPQGEFIRRWVPEIAHLANEDLFAPWQMPPIAQMSMETPVPAPYHCPVIIPEADIDKHRELLWKWRERDEVKHHAKRIVKRHSNPQR